MKQKRQNKIIELISNQEITTQEELADKLKEAGFNVTQAAVSRDIRELKLTKTSEVGGRQKYVILYNMSNKLSEKYKRSLKDGLMSVTLAMNMLVVKTYPGMAMAVAAAIDAMAIPEILGSIAGDDTIMCATGSIPDAEAAAKAINSVINE